MRPEEPEEHGDAIDLDRRSGLKVALLVGVLGIATFAAVAVGKALKPSSTNQPAASTGATTAPAASPATTSAHKPRHVRGKPSAGVHFGLLAAHVVGRFTPAGARASAVVTGTTLVVAGAGRVISGPVGGHLSKIAALPGARVGAEMFALGGSVYLAGGESGSTPTAQILRIDPASSGIVPAGTFEEPLAEAAAQVSGGSVYIVGGWTGQKFATAILRYTPGGAPALVARLPQGLRAPAAAITGHTLVVAGGLTEKGLSRQVYAVDLSSGAVKVLGALPQGIERAALLVVSSKLYLLGGISADGTPVASVTGIDPVSGRVTSAGSMPRPLADAAAVTVGGRSMLVDTRRGVIYRIG